MALRFGADLAVEQIAAALGESTATVEGRLYRGAAQAARAARRLTPDHGVQGATLHCFAAIIWSRLQGNPVSML